MNKNARDADVWLWLTVPMAVLLAIATVSGVFISGLYRDTPNLVAQAIGQDVITLVAALPTLVISAFLTSRGSQRARLVWLGGLIYTVYTYVGYAFDVRFNPLFLVYVALLGCSTYALIGGLITTDWEGFTAGFTERTPTKAISIYLGMVASLFYLLWLSEAVPASLSGNPPQSLIDAGTPTNFVQVLDMAWLLPAIAITAISLWRKRSLGYTLAGALLTHFTLLTLAILSMVAFMVRAGQPVVIPQVVIYGVLFAVSIGMLITYLKNLKSSPSPMP
ncbi:hypothetical protein IQ255_28870 [Pleurocapsales cyanobacterium LEGE 10410]|nr:hypothetical protein [Pleurocapsales cyanobacterium LEGE 10410]